ncbi:carbohydrate ABC transporter permease [Micromonospora saelicesensis]|uniref:Maltodextrin transport system permease protein M dxG n=1 Tax=Micromonospora saelicesensis TaxID=285676 RepID=A0ABX9CCN4_9ACTN|nr:carbohydrate ABC transporter permease [Micromonospora saelicesensis]RAN94373.1 Maltodextrin transport system permease protein M dxG [Micromonospora saelicesensis]RAO46019.1 Maltodextrin transport system permease protein M dxG [Micromonospora saelicesensis]
MTDHTSVRAGARRPQRYLPLQILLGFLVIYFLVPFWWVIVNSSKDAPGLFGGGNTLWFTDQIDYLGNLRQLFTYDGGIYLRWILNSTLYAIAGGVGATVLAVMAGYGFAKYRFAARRFSFAVVLGALMVPATALVIPTFIMFSRLGLTNTVWAVILPSLLNPFGVYLMHVYARDAVPDELLDAARVDGAGEIRTFIQIALPLMRPAVVTVLLLSAVASWNNYFLPLAMLSDNRLFPVTVGLGLWQGIASANNAGTTSLWSLIILGSLVSVIPLIIAFFSLQRHWRGGLSVGGLR